METLVNVLELLLLFLTIIYAAQIFYFYLGIKKTKAGTNVRLHSIAVLIAARNEEQNIGSCLTALLNQDYDHAKYSIHVINDHSSDKTVSIVEKYSSENPGRIILHHAPERAETVSPKINAFRTALATTSSEIILTTDADCIPTTNWITTMNTYFEENVGAVAGFTHFDRRGNASTLLYGVQFLEFISLTLCGAGASGNKNTIISNGSNMGFRRQAFDDIGGYDSFAHHSNGDDSFLVQKIEASKKWTVRFALEKYSYVTTIPVQRWYYLLRQRMRWSSQTTNYSLSKIIFMSAIFLYYALLFVLTLVFLAMERFEILYFFLVKAIIDFAFLYYALNRIHLRPILKYFAAGAVLHFPLVFFSVLGGKFFNYTWKERELKPVNEG